MRLKKISISNMRLVDSEPVKIDFVEDKNITLIVGDNGAGKTTLLDSISYMISPFISQFRGQSLLQISDYDVHLLPNGNMSSYLKIEAEFKRLQCVSDNQNEIVSVMRSRRGSEKAPESNIKDLKIYAEEIESRIKAGDTLVKLPTLAYYGTDRGNIVGPERRRYSSKSYERWDCYTASLISATNFKRFFAWFDLMEDEERRERDARQDYSYKFHVLETVRCALSELLGDKYSKPRIETKPLRFVMDERMENGSVRELRIEQMSAGYKVMIAMVADLAARMAEGNPDSENPLGEAGIVLLDEIDLHLHAKWQRIILSQLSKIFPNVQFIVTTHSPLVVLGANDNKVQLIRLTNEGVEDITCTDMSNYDVSLILLSDAFSLSSVYSAKLEGVFKRRKELLLKEDLSSSEKEELKNLNLQVHSLPELGQTVEQMKIEKYLLEWANKNGIL